MTEDLYKIQFLQIQLKEMKFTDIPYFKYYNK